MTDTFQKLDTDYIGMAISDQVQSLAASLKEALAQLPTEQPPWQWRYLWTW
jgi:hypothetical protein